MIKLNDFDTTSKTLFTPNRKEKTMQPKHITTTPNKLIRIALSLVLVIGLLPCLRTGQAQAQETNTTSNITQEETASTTSNEATTTENQQDIQQNQTEPQAQDQQPSEENDINTLAEQYESEGYTLFTDGVLDPEGEDAQLAQNNTATLLSSEDTATQNLPAKVDLRSRGVVPELVTQHQSDCYSYAACAAAEISLATDTGTKPILLSPTLAAWFTYTPLPMTTSALKGTEITGAGDGAVYKAISSSVYDYGAKADFITGGLSTHVINKWTQGYALAPRIKEDDISFGDNDEWRSVDIPDEDRFKTIARIKNVNAFGSNEIKSQLNNGRGVVFSFYVSGGDYDGNRYTDEYGYKVYGRYCPFAPRADGYLGMIQDENGNWVEEYHNRGTSLSHAACIVGYDDNYSKDNFNGRCATDETDRDYTGKPSQDGAYLVKDSMGGKYYWISYEDFDIQHPKDSFYSIEFDTSATGYNNGEFIDTNKEIVDQYDYSGDNYFCSGYSFDEECYWGANIYTASDDQEIHNIGVGGGISGDISYKIYLLNDNAQDPSDTLYSLDNPQAEGCWRGCGDEFNGYRAYTSIKLDTPVKVKKGQKYAIWVRGINLYGNIEIPLARDVNYSWVGLHDTIHENESFVSTEESGASGSWEDSATMSSRNSNISAKAFATVLDSGWQDSLKPTVTVKTNTKDVADEQYSVNYGDEITLPNVPEYKTENGVRYKFDGWDTNSTTIYSDTIIQAKWKALEFNITYVGLPSCGWNNNNPSIYTTEGLQVQDPVWKYSDETWVKENVFSYDDFTVPSEVSADGYNWKGYVPYVLKDTEELDCTITNKTVYWGDFGKYSSVIQAKANKRTINFIGWTCEDIGITTPTKDLSLPAGIEKNLTLTAHFEDLPNYKFSIVNTINEKVVETKVIQEGDYLNSDKYSGYHSVDIDFVYESFKHDDAVYLAIGGVYTDKALTQKFDFAGQLTPETMPNTDVTLYVNSTIIRQQIWGDTAIETAVETAKKAFEGQTSKNAVLATSGSFYDSMSSTGLAGALDAPILLTTQNNLSDATRDELKELGVETVYIAGGTAAVSDNVEKQLNELGYKTERVWGHNAADTSYECAKKIAEIKGESACDKAIVATSGTFQDAVSMSGYAYANKAPIFLEMGAATAKDAHLTADSIKTLTQGAYKNAHVIVAGGTAAVSEESVQEIRDSGTYDRYWGDNAYETSAAIAENLYDGGQYAVVATGIQSGLGLDALAGGVLAGRLGAPVLLVDMTITDESSKTNYYRRANTTTLQRVGIDYETKYYLGGQAVMPQVLDLKAKYV